MRTACYARFSSDLQRDTSLDDQIRNCCEYAARLGWTWQDDQIFTDAAISGASIDGRAGLHALLTAADASPRAFDVLLVDDSSRVARDLADALRVLQRLRFAGVRVIYISQGIDSASEQAETLVAVHGLVDGLYLREMAQKIRRGIVGQMERGFSTGGQRYGYRRTPVEDPSGRRDANGRAAVIGTRLEVEPAEAATIVEIFTWYAAGVGVPSIIQRLNARGGKPWKAGAVRRLLRNERFIGKHIYGQVRFERNPGTRQKVARRVPRSQWRIIDRPEWRIISDELWAAVQARRAFVSRTFAKQGGSTRMRGRNAFLHSKHLFSGFLTCGVCGGAITIVGGGHGKPRYGCQQYAKNGPSACTNKLTIQAHVADAALLAGLQAQLLRPETVAYLTEQLSAELNAVIDERPKRRAALEHDRTATATKLQHLLAAIENGMASDSVINLIRTREAELAALDAKLDDTDEPLRARLAVLPVWVRQQVADAVDLFSGAPERAKTEFQKLGVRFTVRPVYSDGQRAYLTAEGSGAFDELAFAPYAHLTARGASHQQSDRRRTFLVRLPACQPYVRKTG